LTKTELYGKILLSKNRSYKMEKVKVTDLGRGAKVILDGG